jgi:hypothetical protein
MPTAPRRPTDLCALFIAHGVPAPRIRAAGQNLERFLCLICKQVNELPQILVVGTGADDEPCAPDAMVG